MALLPLPACGERSARAARRVRGRFTLRGADNTRTSQARRLRRDSTDAERVLWKHLRSRTIAGHKFVRQQPVGPYIVDFVCRESRLIVEVDGGQHAESAGDQIRDRWLVEHNYRVFRFWNNEV